MIGGLYRPGHSPIHRLPAGTKLSVLAIAGAGLFFVGVWWGTIAALAVAAGLYALAGFGPAVLFRQIRPILFILAVLFAAEWWVGGAERAVVTTSRFAALLLLAALVTLTTRPAEIIATIERLLAPLERFGANGRKTGLAIALVLRFIPVLSEILQQAREAQKARGGKISIRRLAVPVIVRTLKLTDEVAEAIDARGFDAPPPKRGKARGAS